MSFLKGIFSKKKDDFESVLASLATDIQNRQVKLSEIRLREKRSTLLVTVYTLLAWVAYTSLWYWGLLPSIWDAGGHAVAERVIRGIPVLVGPVVILFIRRIVQVWYARKANAEEKMLQSLMKQRRVKVEEIKKKTNFDSMVKLFQEYDEPSPGATPLRQRAPPQATPVTPQRQPGPVSPFQTPMPAALRAQLTPIPSPFPMAPPRKQWYDKLADALLGDDDNNHGSPSSRYALICEKCFTHNGLVKEGLWEDAQFICRNPKCNHLNRSARSKREAPSLNTSPQSNAASRSPTSRPMAFSDSPLPRQHPSASPPHKPPVSDSSFDAPTVDGVDTSTMEVDT